MLGVKCRLASLISIPIKKTSWYKEAYGDMLKFKKQQFNTQFVVLGSSPAKYAFDESATDVKCANWATEPQSIADDFRILKNYHSYISPNGFVLLFLSHCRGLMRDYKESTHFRKYHYLLHPILNPYYEENVYCHLKNEIDYPVIYIIKHPLIFIRSVISKDILKHNINNLCTNQMDEKQLQQDAEKWMNCWKREFGENAFNTPLTKDVQNSLDFNKKLVLEIAEFCKERSLNLVFITTPITDSLKSNFTKEFTQKALYDLIAPAQKKYGIQLIDYLKNEEFENTNLYFNSFFLNKNGRKKFTLNLLDNLMKNTFLLKYMDK